jgi:cbb3-type cytochrome oxidase maturation protein
MNVLVFLIPMAILLGLIGLYGLFWTLRRGQYEDLQGAAYRILLDDDIKDDPEQK